MTAVTQPLFAGGLSAGPARTWFNDHGDPSPSVARITDYLLGGMHNTAPDRRLAATLLDAWPDLRAHLHAGRHAQHRMIRYLVRHGVRQFLDIGSGIADRGATHQITAASTRELSTVVYVDIDPITVHLNTMLLHHQPGTRAALGTLADAGSITAHPDVTGTLELGEPVAVLLFNVLQHLPPAHTTTDVLARLLETCVAGSYIAVSHLDLTTLPDPQPLVDGYAQTPTGVYRRPIQDITTGLAALTPVEPGLVPAHQWRPDTDSPAGPALHTVLARYHTAEASSRSVHPVSGTFR